MCGEDADVRSGDQKNLHDRRTAGVLRDNHRVGPAAQVTTEEQYQTMRDAGMFDDDVAGGAADAILFERARLLLLGGAEPGESL